MRLEGLSQVDGTPVLSDNVQHLANVPGQVGIYLGDGQELVAVDVTEPTAPTIGRAPGS